MYIYMNGVSNAPMNSFMRLTLSCRPSYVRHILDISVLVHFFEMLDKLEVFKFAETSIKWFDSYLSERKQFVQVESKLSESKSPGRVGVPQGSILGPLIFLLMCLDFPASTTEGNSVIYVDDDTVTVSDKKGVDVIQKIQREATKATDWVADNKMVCSGEKTKLIIMGTYERKRKLENEDINTAIEVCGKQVDKTNE